MFYPVLYIRLANRNETKRSVKFFQVILRSQFYVRICKMRPAYFKRLQHQLPPNPFFLCAGKVATLPIDVSL
jgi:hypothetical protein